MRSVRSKELPEELKDRAVVRQDLDNRGKTCVIYCF